MTVQKKMRHIDHQIVVVQHRQDTLLVEHGSGA
jgi:hypothetical protein